MKLHYSLKFLSPFFTIVLLTTQCKEGKLQDNLSTKTEIPEKDTYIPKKDTISIIAVGDLMIGSGFPSGKLPKDDAKTSFDKVKNHINGDIVFGNLEGCLLDHGNSGKCKDKDPGKCYAFRMPERYGEIFKNVGFNLFSIANNHVGDFGTAGRNKTAEILNQLQINYAGQNDKPSALFEIDGIKYGFCAFAPNNNTVSINDIPNAQKIVKELKSQCDIVIVSFHGGGEGAGFTHVTKKSEVFYGENRGNVYAFSHAVVDAGADLVLGHGPHVLRAVEVYKNRFIAYSLGNFNTYGMFSLNGPNGYAVLLDIKINTKGEFFYAKVISTKQDKQSGLRIDDDHLGFRQIKKLTQEDFSNHNLVFKKNKILVKINTL